MDLAEVKLGSERDFRPENPALTPISPGWHASLDLRFERRKEGSVLAARNHDGPLVVQKPFYPEGPDICHALVLHPPNGIAGGDDLEISARAKEGSHAVLATPGAGKWYRSSGAWARQRIRFQVEAKANLEWLPQEAIVYDGARADMVIDINVANNASYLGWEILCLGRSVPAKPWSQGWARLRTRITRDGRLLFIERGCFDARSALVVSPAGMAGASVSGTMIAVPGALAGKQNPPSASANFDAEPLTACRALKPREGQVGLTVLPGVLIARYLGDSSEAAKNYFIALRRLLRPVVMQCEANDLRIWST